jgi:hypothetical protein
MYHVAALTLTLLLATQANAMGKPLPPCSVPEPAAYALFAAGGVVVGWAISRLRRK